MSNKRCVSVYLRPGEKIDFALKRLKRLLKRDNFYNEIKKREFYQKPSEIKRQKKRRKKLVDGIKLNGDENNNEKLYDRDLLNNE